jgi:hypothetical protein
LPFVSDASDLVSDDNVPIPSLLDPLPKQSSACGAAALHADSDDDVRILRFFHPILL